MKSLKFINFTDKTFTGWWDGKSRKFKPGESLSLPAYLAEHYAKHLVNWELLRVDEKGELIHKNGDKMTSPKFPKQVPLFMELFNRACMPEEVESEEIGGPEDDVDAIVDSINKNKGNQKPDDNEKDEFQEKPL